MPNDSVSYQDSGFFSPLIVDYLNQNENLKPFYNRFSTIENFEVQIADKSINYNDGNRKILVSSLEKQYRNNRSSELTLKNIALLNNSATFTVTTGHQLNLFSGPLYFLYKIVTAINLAQQLKQKYPKFDFVPIYWMATEDHDFAEINHFNFKDKKVIWERESNGPVGRLSYSGLEAVLAEFSELLNISQNADALRSMFKNAYLNHENLADATRFLANELFGKHGLVILDADEPELKTLFADHITTELTQQISAINVEQTISKLDNYKIQVSPREINLFYITDTLRERIIFEDNLYVINNTDLKFTRDEILLEVNKHPERFSPNVIMRPLYQEVILPNLCYIGGGGEIAYWLELKSYFDASKVTFPILLIRNSVLLATKKQAEKADALQLLWADLFLSPFALSTKKTKSISEYDIELTALKDNLKKQFDALYLISEQTDKSFSGAVKAQLQKQLKGLQMLEKRLLKSEKTKHEELLERILNLKLELFPHNALQERNQNFSVYYEQFGESLIDKLLSELKPLDNEFKILVL